MVIVYYRDGLNRLITRVRADLYDEIKTAPEILSAWIVPGTYNGE